MVAANFFLLAGDIFFDALHSGLMLFVLCGWMFAKTRRFHLILLLLVLASWTLLGFWFGWGYCVLTDLHWQIKRQLGQLDMPPSYIAFSIKRLFGVVVSERAVDVGSYIALGISFFMAVARKIPMPFIKSEVRS